LTLLMLSPVARHQTWASYSPISETMEARRKMGML
jgi:hypothetical protein